MVIASPDYLRRHGTPAHASDLEQHHCIAFSLAPNPLIWEFKKGDELVHVKLSARALCNNAETMIALTCAGIGITRMPLFNCEREVSDGRVEIILDDYEPSTLGVYAVYPHRQYLTAKVRVFVDYLVERFSATDGVGSVDINHF